MRPLPLFIVLAATLVLAGCLQTPSLNATPTLQPRFNATTLNESVDVARAFVENSSTFACSGVPESLAFDGATALDTPYAWSVSFTYTARVVQYGCPDLSSPAMTQHRIDVVVDQGVVASALVDGAYDELKGSFLPDDQEVEDASLTELIQLIQTNYPQTQGIVACDADVGCETDVLSRPVRGGWRIVFFRGAGDCQAGCIERHYYHFLAYANRTIEYQGETDRYVDDAQGQFCGGIAAIPCPRGYTCELDGDYPDAGGACAKNAAAECVTSADCAPTGCSGEVCAARTNPVVTTCEYRAEFVCFDNPAECGCVNNQCAWSESVRECVFEKQNDALNQPA